MLPIYRRVPSQIIRIKRGQAASGQVVSVLVLVFGLHLYLMHTCKTPAIQAFFSHSRGLRRVYTPWFEYLISW